MCPTALITFRSSYLLVLFSWLTRLFRLVALPARAGFRCCSRRRVGLVELAHVVFYRMSCIFTLLESFCDQTFDTSAHAFCQCRPAFAAAAESENKSGWLQLIDVEWDLDALCQALDHLGLAYTGHIFGNIAGSAPFVEGLAFTGLAESAQRSSVRCNIFGRA